MAKVPWPNPLSELFDPVTYRFFGEECPRHGRPTYEIRIQPTRLLCKNCQHDDPKDLEPEGAWT